MWMFSRCCKNISAILPEIGDPWLLPALVGISDHQKQNNFVVE